MHTLVPWALCQYEASNLQADISIRRCLQGEANNVPSLLPNLLQLRLELLFEVIDLCHDVVIDLILAVLGNKLIAVYRIYSQ